MESQRNTQGPDDRTRGQVQQVCLVICQNHSSKGCNRSAHRATVNQSPCVGCYEVHGEPPRPSAAHRGHEPAKEKERGRPVRAQSQSRGTRGRAVRAPMGRFMGRMELAALRTMPVKSSLRPCIREQSLPPEASFLSAFRPTRTTGIPRRG